MVVPDGPDPICKAAAKLGSGLAAEGFAEVADGQKSKDFPGLSANRIAHATSPESLWAPRSDLFRIGALAKR